MKAISAAIIVLAGALVTTGPEDDLYPVGFGMILVGALTWIFQMLGQEK